MTIGQMNELEALRFIANAIQNGIGEAATTSPGGSSGDLQTNNAGAFGGLTPGAGVATFLATPSSANLAAAVTGGTGTGALVFATSPTLVTPILGTPTSGTVTNLTGTASININGTVGATTPLAGAFTTLIASTSVTTGTTSIITNPAAATTQLGADHATAAVAQIIKGPNTTTGTGGGVKIAGGTGSVAGGAVILATSATTGAPVDRLTIASTGIATFSSQILSATSGAQGSPSIGFSSEATGLYLSGSAAPALTINGTVYYAWTAGAFRSVSGTTDLGTTGNKWQNAFLSGTVAAGAISTSATDFMHITTGTLANGAAAQLATITNGPTAGNPTKWIPINDNGTTRYIPAW